MKLNRFLRTAGLFLCILMLFSAAVPGFAKENAPETERGDLPMPDRTLPEGPGAQPQAIPSGGVSGQCGENVYWTLTKDGTLTIRGTGKMTDFDVFDNTPPWYNYTDEIVKAEIAQGVTSIGDEAFIGCDHLASITIPSSVTSIGYAAFSVCTNLGSVTIPFGVTTIGKCAFEYCESLTSVTIPSSVTSIGERMFANCYNLNSVTIRPGVTSIGESSFSYCKSLVSITIPSSVTSIERHAFAYCKSLASVTIPSNVTSIVEGAFIGCESLTDIWYSGTRTQWSRIYIEPDNELLLAAQLHRRGDMNGDTLVTSDDAICLLRWVLGLPGFEANQPVDFDGDGYATSDDAIYLLRHVLSPNRYPLN